VPRTAREYADAAFACERQEVNRAERIARLPWCRLERVVSIFEYDVSERAFRLLPDGLEDKQIRCQMTFPPKTTTALIRVR
jgi:hypothetical protein